MCSPAITMTATAASTVRLFAIILTIIALSLSSSSSSSTFVFAQPQNDTSSNSNVTLNNPTPVCTYTSGSYCLPQWMNLTSNDARDDGLQYGVIPCTSSMYCEQDQLPILCPKGYYCPTPVQKIPCPVDHWCPTASTTPNPCSTLAYCAAGSERYFHVGCLIFCTTLLLVLTLLPRIQHAIETRIMAKQQTTVVEQDAVKTGVAASSTPVAADHHDAGGSNRRGSSSSLMHQLTNVPPLAIKFRNIHVEIAHKIIIQSITAQFRPGRLTAIMGPSGAGKSSLFSCLFGDLSITSGHMECTINHTTPITNTQLASIRSSGLVGMVAQSDIMLPELSIYDCFVHTAMTRLSNHYTREQKLARVKQVISLLKLEHVQHMPIGDDHKRGISGGQKKRASIGIELVCHPSLLCLDEPTSGLDASSSAELLELLKSLTASSVAVVAVLHQPRSEIFSLLDDILLLAPNGYTVYFGPANEILSYFASLGFVCPITSNPADFLIDIVANKIKPQKVSNPDVAAAALATAAAGQMSESLNDASASSSIIKTVSSSISPSAVKKYMKEQAHFSSQLQALGAAAGMPSIEVAEQIAKLNKEANEHCTHYLITSWQSQQQARMDAYDQLFSYTDVIVAASSSHPSSVSLSPVHDFNASTLPSFHTQLYYHFTRAVLQLYRDISIVRFEMFMHLITGAIIGMAFVENLYFIPPLPRQYVALCPTALRKQCDVMALNDKFNLLVTFITMALGLVAAVIGNRNYGTEHLNIRREMSAGAHLLSYYLGKFMCDFCLILIYAFIFCTSFVLVASPPAKFGEFYLMIWLFEMTLFSLGYLISTLFVQQEYAQLASVVAALLAGLATDAKSIEKNLCWARWFSEALYIASMRVDLLSPSVESVVRAYSSGGQKWNMDNTANDCIALAIFIGLFNIAAYFTLRKRVKKTAHNGGASTTTTATAAAATTNSATTAAGPATARN